MARAKAGQQSEGGCKVAVVDDTNTTLRDAGGRVGGVGERVEKGRLKKRAVLSFFKPPANLP